MLFYPTYAGYNPTRLNLSETKLQSKPNQTQTVVGVSPRSEQAEPIS